MRIPSGTTDQYIYFVAVDATDLKTRETGLTGFTVYRSRNNGTATAMTTPTTTEPSSANMPGVYGLLLDEDMTIGSGNDSEEMAFHISHANMAPVTRVIELYRPKITVGYTLGVGSDGDLLEVNTLTGHTAQTGDNYTRIGATGSGLTSLASASALSTAQTDLDTLTGTDGATLATAQGNYAPAKAGDAMTLTAAATSAQLVDDIWDEALTSGSHDVADSAGRRVRQIQEAGMYEGGAVWIDTVNGSSGTTSYENGTVNNPVNSIGDAKTIADAVGLDIFQLVSNSSITLAASFDNYTFKGYNYTVALNGQSVSGTRFENATITGNDDGSNSTATIYYNCLMGTNTLGLHYLVQCGLGATITIAEAGTYDWVFCHSRVAGVSTPSVSFGAAVANTNLNMRHYSGGIEVQNIGDSGTDNMSLEGNGQLVINSNSSGGTIAIRGNFTVTDNAGGAVTLSDNARIDVGQINDQVVDALDTDTYAEPGQGTPGATISLSDKISYLYKAWRNKATQTSSQYSLYNDAGDTVDQKATVSDNGTTATMEEKVTGP